MLLTVKQAADRLQVDPGLVYRLGERAEIAHSRVGLGRGVIRIPEERIAEYLSRKSRTVAASFSATTRKRATRKPPSLKHFTVG